MLVFLAVVIVLGIGLELYAYFDGTKHISFQYKPDKLYVEPGEAVTVSAEMTNSGRMPISYATTAMAFPVNAQLPDVMPSRKEQFIQWVETDFRLRGRQKVTKSLRVTLSKRGVHFFKGAKVARGDFLGLYQISEIYHDQIPVLVYPKALESQTLCSAIGAYCGDIIAKRHLLRDPVLQMGVREYTGNEPMKTISWTQTARRGQLMVREFDFTRDLSCTVLLSLDGWQPNDENKLDNCCSIVRTVCEELTSQNISVDFYTNGPLMNLDHGNQNMWSCTAGKGNMSDILHTLALLHVAPVRRQGQQMAVSAVRASDRSTAFVIVALRETEILQQMVRIIREESGMDVLVLLEADFNNSEQERS